MRAFFLTVLMFSGCDAPGAGVGEQGFVAPNTGFKLFGGEQERCLAPTGGVAAAGRSLVSATCVRYGGGQSWRVSSPIGGQTISPATNLGLCVDDRGAAPVLAACDGSYHQKWQVNHNIRAPNNYQCLAVSGGALASGTPIVFASCSNDQAQVMWPYGHPMQLWNSVRLGPEEFLDDPAPGWPVIGDPDSNAPSENFVFGLDNTIQQYTSAGPKCLTDGSFVSMQNCGQGASQQWTLTIGWGFWESGNWDSSPSIVGPPAGLFQPSQCLSMDDYQRVTMEACQLNSRPMVWDLLLN